LQHLDSDDYLSEEENLSTGILWELPFEYYDQDDESYGIEDLFMPTNELKLDGPGCPLSESGANMEFKASAVTMLSDANLPDFYDERRALDADLEAEIVVQPNLPSQLQNCSDTFVGQEIEVFEDFHHINFCEAYHALDTKFKPGEIENEDSRETEEELIEDLNCKVVMCDREISKLSNYVDPFLESPFTHYNFFLFVLREPKLTFESYYGCLQDTFLLLDHPLHAIIHIKLRGWKAFSRIG